jgi:hypothetical protein
VLKRPGDPFRTEGASVSEHNYIKPFQPAEQPLNLREPEESQNTESVERNTFNLPLNA